MVFIIVFATVFQAERYANYAILVLPWLHVQRTHNFEARNKKVTIFTDSQKALKTVEKPKMSLKLVRECVQELSGLGTSNIRKDIFGFLEY